MNSLSQYITEKFKISKNISDGNNFDILDKFSYGMTCLILTSLYNPRIILVELGKIVKFNKKTIVLENLTHFEEKDKIIFKPDPKQNNNWLYPLQSISDNRTAILIPQEEIKDIIDFIIKNQYKLDFSHLLITGESISGTTVKRVGNRRWTSLKFSFLEHEDIEEIYKILNNLDKKY